MRRLVIVAAGVVSLLATVIAARQTEQLRYDREYPFLKYGTTEPAERVASVRARLARQEVRLPRGDRGYLDSVLAALDIDASSQMLVFSRTSLQTGFIRASTPRAIYFNDDTYVAFVPGAGNLEITSLDPALGPVFFTLKQQDSVPQLERQTSTCLACHDSMSLTGGGVPRFIIGSGYTKPTGDLVSHEGWIVTTQRTPLRSRWGGWFVTGKPAATVHLGNMLVPNAAALKDLDKARRGTVASLDGTVETSRYPRGTSDIVALLVFEHQVTVQNAIVKASYEARSAQARSLEAIAEPLVDALFSVGAAALPEPIVGSSGFAEAFASRGPRDKQGRSLRELDLQRRVFKYPLSYLIYSSAFQALPAPLRKVVDARVDAVLRGADAGGRFQHLTAADRSAIQGILKETR